MADESLCLTEVLRRQWKRCDSIGQTANAAGCRPALFGAPKKSPTLYHTNQVPAVFTPDRWDAWHQRCWQDDERGRINLTDTGRESRWSVHFSMPKPTWSALIDGPLPPHALLTANMSTHTRAKGTKLNKQQTASASAARGLLQATPALKSCLKQVTKVVYIDVHQLAQQQWRGSQQVDIWELEDEEVEGKVEGLILLASAAELESSSPSESLTDLLAERNAELAAQAARHQQDGTCLADAPAWDWEVPAPASSVAEGDMSTPPVPSLELAADTQDEPHEKSLAAEHDTSDSVIPTPASRVSIAGTSSPTETYPMCAPCNVRPKMEKDESAAALPVHHSVLTVPVPKADTTEVPTSSEPEPALYAADNSEPNRQDTAESPQDCSVAGADAPDCSQPTAALAMGTLETPIHCTPTQDLAVVNDAEPQHSTQPQEHCLAAGSLAYDCAMTAPALGMGCDEKDAAALQEVHRSCDAQVLALKVAHPSDSNESDMCRVLAAASHCHTPTAVVSICPPTKFGEEMVPMPKSTIHSADSKNSQETPAGKPAGVWRRCWAVTKRLVTRTTKRFTPSCSPSCFAASRVRDE